MESSRGGTRAGRIYQGRAERQAEGDGGAQGEGGTASGGSDAEGAQRKGNEMKQNYQTNKTMILELNTNSNIWILKKHLIN